MEKIALDLGTATRELHGRPATIPVAPFLIEGWGVFIVATGRFFSGPIRINLRYVSSFGHIFSKSHVTVLNMFRPTMYGESMMISLM